MDWYEQTFGVCAHGNIKPYCAPCVGERDLLERQEREAKRLEQHEKQLQASVIASQSQRIAAQSTEINRLRRVETALRNQMAERRMRRNLRREQDA